MNIFEDGKQEREFRRSWLRREQSKNLALFPVTIYIDSLNSIFDSIDSGSSTFLSISIY